MANPNLKNLNNVFGENASISGVPTSPSGILTCQSNQVLKVNSLYISNINTNNSANATIDLYNGTSVLNYFIRATVVGAGGSINIITGGSPVYITEGQTIRISASSNNDLSAFISYERIAWWAIEPGKILFIQKIPQKLLI